MTPNAEPSAPTPDAAGPAHAWHLVLGLALWFAWFCVTYGGLAVACAVAPPPPEAGSLNWLNAIVLLLAGATTAGFGASAWTSARTARRLPAGSDAARHPLRCALLHAAAIWFWHAPGPYNAAVQTPVWHVL